MSAESAPRKFAKGEDIGVGHNVIITLINGFEVVGRFFVLVLDTAKKVPMKLILKLPNGEPAKIDAREVHDIQITD